MSVKIGAGGGPPYSSDSPGASEPSGRLQVLEPKDFPFLHTGHSLVFVIARNGMVWGKRLDEQSSNGDIELEVFWPSEDGCLIQIKGSRGNSNSVVLGYPLPVYISLSQSQRDKINSILSQKEIIQYELGTLMVRPHRDWLPQPQYQRITTACKLDFPLNEPCDIKVIDCSYGQPSLTSNSSNSGIWHLRYEESSSDFLFSSEVKMISVKTSERYSGLGDIKLDYVRCWYTEHGEIFYAARAKNGKFDVSDWSVCKDLKLFKSNIHIMYGEYDFFEYFEVDDAVLLLEVQSHHEERPKLFWTIAIAQNKHVREMMRLASNNPDLFASICAQRRGGGVTTGPY